MDEVNEEPRSVVEEAPSREPGKPAGEEVNSKVNTMTTEVAEAGVVDVVLAGETMTSHNGIETRRSTSDPSG